MIKRYTLHIEFHWGYWPRISIKRVPAPGDKVHDGGYWGTLKACPECSGVGLLHVVDPAQFMAGRPDSLYPTPLYDDRISPPYLVLGYERGVNNYQGGEQLWTRNAEYIVQYIKDRQLYLTRKDVWEQKGHPLH